MKNWLKIVAAFSVAASACGQPDSRNPKSVDPDPRTKAQFFDTLDEFSSEGDFDSYMGSLTDPYRDSDDYTDGNNAPAAESDSGASAEPTNENITNNQEEGVDEGGIVKNIGDYLVVLRKGRLFTVNVAESSAAEQSDSIRVAANDDLNQNVWYDEMLVDGDDVYVIGYRYLSEVVGANGKRLSHIWGATEINSFRVETDGSIERLNTSFVESNDYYSFDNSASRLVDGKIVYYMPFYAFFRSNGARQTHIPQILQHVSGSKFQAKSDLFTWKDVIRPLSPPANPTFHTVVSCELDDGALDCGARTLLGDWWREYYVSANHVFLWGTEQVYAISQRDLDVATHAARGFPPSQFAFREAEGTLHVGVHTHPEDGSTDPQKVEMLSLPIADFDDKGEQTLERKSTTLMELADGNARLWKNRHVNGWWLAGVDIYETGSERNLLLAHKVGTDISQELPLQNPTWQSRIEAMPGVGALLVESTGTDLQMRTIEFAQESVSFAPDGAIMKDAQEGETRSHGFFFKPTDQGGFFGLPIINGGYGNGWGFGVSNIAFYEADPSGKLQMLGSVSSTDDANGGCETSCIDWYGNTRPIFLRDRIYALMGSELQEAAVDSSGVTEIGERVVLSF